MAESKIKIDSLANGCPAEGGDEIEISVGVKTVKINVSKIDECPAAMPVNVSAIESAGKKTEEESKKDCKSQLEPKVHVAKEIAAVTATITNKTAATTGGSKTQVEETREKFADKVFEDGKVLAEEILVESVDESSGSVGKDVVKNSPSVTEKETVEEVSKGTLSEEKQAAVSETKKSLEESLDVKPGEEKPPVIDIELYEEIDKSVETEGDRDQPILPSEIDEIMNRNKNEERDEREEEDEDDDEEEIETGEPEEVEDEDEEDDEEDDDDEEDENDNEQLELGIVGPPTAVSELINEEELRCGESVLLTEDRGGVENIQDHVAEWVQNSANNKVEELTIDEDEVEEPGATPTDQKNQKNAENIDKNAEVLATRKSKKVVSNIIKKSIKCLNKIHAMDASGVVIKSTEKGKRTKKVEKLVEKEENKSELKTPKECRQREPAAAPQQQQQQQQQQRNHRDRRNHHNHSNHSRNGRKELPGDRESYSVKKELTSEPETDPEPERGDAVPELRKRPGSDRIKNVKTEKERECKKRRSTDEIQNSNGKSKRACLEQREEFISSLVGGDKVTTEELTVRAEQLRAELQALDQLARAKEKEWNEILSMRKLKEEAYFRIERRRQVVGFMEGNNQLNETSVIPSVSLSLEPEWDNAKEKSNSTEATFSDKSITRPQVTSKQNENGQKESSDGQNSENRQIGEGRQGPMVDVRTIIADYRLRHPETVPRRSRRMRNSVNVGLGAGGAMVETTHVGADSRPSSTDSCKSSSNATDPSNSMSFKDVLVQFAKLSQQQGEAVKTPQNYPDVTLHPVLPSPAAPQTAAVQQSGSLLHGILTKSQSPRPTTFSPTLARLLTAPERERCNPIATSTPQQATATQHLLQAYQGTNPVSISDLLSSSKARTEITITPVVNTPTPQSHSNNLIHVEDVEEETTVLEERGRSSNARDDSPPRCQGCQDRAAQFVCAGCGNQWYCSRECQVSAWDEHSEVCSG